MFLAYVITAFQQLAKRIWTFGVESRNSALFGVRQEEEFIITG